MDRLKEYYGELVFDHKKMKERLSSKSYQLFIKTVQDGAPLDEMIAEDIARAMKDWAVENGASHFTHWFQPQRSGTAEKHDAFLDYDKEGGVIEKFSKSQLIQSEPDASSFPSGGIRSTFEARGYTAWDPSSPAFLRDSGNGLSLVIPSLYLSWTGEALDMKTPLLRSLEALNKEAIALQKRLGNRSAKRIKVYSGLEQEYFLISKPFALERNDLMTCGRTVFGAAPVKGQLMEDHYFGSIKPRVMSFMNDLDKELYRYGIPVKTKHNEVAPNQFEIAPLYEEMNLAIDHNLQLMDIMRSVADEHDFVCLHHEKPFAGLNGSGKHMNWSIGDNTGTNYLEPSRSPLKNISFLLTLGALLLGMNEHAGLLRAAIADAGNEHRLGSHEAPPAILSVYLGDYLTELLDHIEGASSFTDKEINYITHGIQNMPRVVKDHSDRNRTSPIAFTGNKFELRALGSNANGSDAGVALNMICAYGYREILARLEKSKQKDIKKASLEILKDVFKETKRYRFEGNNYSDDWRKEAKKRKLHVEEVTPKAIQYYESKACISLFESFAVLSEREVRSRTEIKYDAYSCTKLIEYKIAIDILRTKILPSLKAHIIQAGEANELVMSVGIKKSCFDDEVREYVKLYETLKKEKGLLIAYVEKAEHEPDSYKKAYSLATKGLELLAAVRQHVDTVESLIADDLWPLPRYDELLNLDHF
ncbi:glutamine synthetase type III [Candidatus Marinamargulisbacteria bacterium SCGC AG-439-L15]|nr:glutamine synthetase type III [Candidatus Marinamargulisbacteria bacterium SCGC AG-439-L15]